MSKPRKELKVEVALKSSKKEEEPLEEIKEKVPEKDLPIWSFPLKQKSVRAKTLKEAQEKLI